MKADEEPIVIFSAATVLVLCYDGVGISINAFSR
jgi:hypothetical protein